MATATAIKKRLAAHGYIIPSWCQMSILDHDDGMGGCWGISGGRVKEHGEKYCGPCEFHKNKLYSPPQEDVTMKKKNIHAVRLGRLGGLARAKKLTKEEMSDIGKLGAQTARVMGKQGGRPRKRKPK